MSEERAVVVAVVRAIATVGLLSMVYLEAGFWTAVTLTLMALTFEMNSRRIGEDDE